jgi:hypothetical protein
MMNIKQESYMGGRRPDSQMQNRWDKQMLNSRMNKY